MSEVTMEKIVSLAKQRGFVYPGSEIYGGLANSWDYGPLGAELKNNIKKMWWSRFVHRRDDIVGLDAGLIMNPRVWQASGHLQNFSDALVECKKCHSRFKQEDLIGRDARNLPAAEAGRVSGTCSNCGSKDFTAPKNFNLMFKTFLGTTEDAASAVYLRPETAQAMFVDFKSVLNTSRKKIPFGIAQIGKAFRNEITPGNFIFRTREFEMMEIEYFIPAPENDKEWQKYFEDWRKDMREWMKDIGLKDENIHELNVGKEELAHYSKKTIDFQYDFPFGREELYGLAYRTDFDLKNHQTQSGADLRYQDPDTGQEYIPHVIEPTWGVDRTMLAVLCAAYDDSDKERTVLHLKPALAPYTAAVFPLLKNKPDLVDRARAIYDDLRKNYMTAWDERGNVGKRYYSQDQIGTPYCVTIDFETLENETVTVRDRDTARQERVGAGEIGEFLENKLNF